MDSFRIALLRDALETDDRLVRFYRMVARVRSPKRLLCRVSRICSCVSRVIHNIDTRAYWLKQGSLLRARDSVDRMRPLIVGALGRAMLFEETDIIRHERQSGKM